MAEGKMPDAAEWAPRFVTSYYSLGVDQVTPLLADFQRQTLLAAAQQRPHRGGTRITTVMNGKRVRYPKPVWVCSPECVKCWLERLAEGRQP